MPGPPSHVTMYAGDGKMVHAARTGQPICFDEVTTSYHAGRFMSAVRPGASD
ncbi:C40 family peptidase [Nocardiopsis exhalans]|uniref:C40 family peptidase n=1 Tax=Nocardiopsis exhalans TaxID=163604 RepID=A0ABY5DJR5_9ACTN|nr:NlpC/P60 family protein [Nocardiopsis exhalans]USY23503.1 C40 family peptidase [Nocardiopsis exhalans]